MVSTDLSKYKTTVIITGLINQTGRLCQSTNIVVKAAGIHLMPCDLLNQPMSQLNVPNATKKTQKDFFHLSLHTVNLNPLLLPLPAVAAVVQGDPVLPVGIEVK